MTLEQRILICGVITLFFSSYVICVCDWREGENPEYDILRCRHDPYELNCYSTVTYNLQTCSARNDEQVYDYNLILNLVNPDENPFLANVTFYTELRILNGYLVTVPKDVLKMTKLTDIKISGNRLRKINLNYFLPLPNLKKIDLVNNTLIVIETQHGETNIYSSVQDIDMSFNSIEDVPNNFVKRFRELEHLNLSYNMISNIDKHAFEGTVQLKTLDLSHNRLKEVGNLFAQLPKLIDTNYDMSKNLQKLSKLVIDDNNLTNVNFTEFFETGIPELSIGGNPIPCYVFARMKYSKFSEKFDHIITAKYLNFETDNINGIACLEAQNDIKDMVIVQDNPSSNLSVLISLLKNTVANNGQSIDALIDIVNEKEKKLEHFIELTSLMLTNINTQLKELKEILPNKFVLGYQLRGKETSTVSSNEYVSL